MTARQSLGGAMKSNLYTLLLVLTIAAAIAALFAASWGTFVIWAA